MKREAIITIIIILLILIGELVTQNYTKKTLGKTQEQLKNLKEEILNTQNDNSKLIEKTDTSRAIVKTLEKNGFLKLQEQKVVRDPLLNKDITRTKNLQFTILARPIL